MKRRSLKTLLLASLVLLLGVSPTFAHDNVKADQSNVSPRATTFSIHGGHGEWGYGLVNMWGKYWHTSKEHRVVLIKDNSYLYGAWEGAGATESYREASKGSNMNCTGEVK